MPNFMLKMLENIIYEVYYGLLINYDRNDLSFEIDDLINAYIDAAEPFSDKPY